MATPKGYFSQTKEDRVGSEHVTVSKGDNKIMLDVRDVGPVTQVASDAAEALSTATVIVATAHTARAGERIRMTSGANDGLERDILSVDTNDITLVSALDSAPAPGDTFAILRPVSVTLSSTGGTSSVTTFVRDEGSGPFNQEVTEDTVTPANNRPLPVKLVDLTGDITVTANELNINLDSANDSVEIIQSTHDNVNLNANMQVGDADVANGNPVPISDAGGSITVDNTNLDAALSTLATQATLSTLNGKFVNGTDIGDVTINNAGGASAVNIQDGGNSITVDGLVTVQDGGGSITIDNANLDVALSTLATQATAAVIAGDTTSLDAKVPAQGSALTAASLPVNIASDQTVPVSAASLPLPTGAATEATLATIDADTSALAGTVSGTELQVDIVASLPAGTNNIGDVDIASALPAGTNNIGDVDIASALPTGSNTIGAVNLNRLDVVDHLDTPLLDAASTNIPVSGTYLQVVASTAADIEKIQIFDTTGEFWGIYTGAAASETLAAVVGPGSNETVEVAIPSGTRISLSSLTASAITSGNVTMNLMG
jgi:hypothetical protein